MSRVAVVAFFSVLAIQPLVGRGFSRADSVIRIHQQPQSQAPQFSEGDLASATLIMSRHGGGGFGYEQPTDLRNSPQYSVGIYGDGTVTYIGTSGVGMLGTLTHRVPADTVRTLIEEFIRVGFFGLDNNYRSINLGEVLIWRTHQAETTLTLSIGSRSKSVHAEFGVPYKIRELGRRVEDVTDVRRYTGRPPQPEGPHTLTGRITSNDGAALAGVKVNMLGAIWYEAVTDADGRYRIGGIFPNESRDEYTLIASTSGFINAVARPMFKADSPPLDWSPFLTRHTGPLPLLELLSRLNLFIRSSTKNCGHHVQADSGGREADVTTLERFVECAVAAGETRTPFRIVVEQRGDKSLVAHGVVGGPEPGRTYLYSYDGSRLDHRLCGRFEVTTDAQGRTRITCASSPSRGAR